MNNDDQLNEIYEDIDKLMFKILERLNSQSRIIVGWTKLRVIKLFINQIAEGGNKVHLTDELKKIETKINNLPKEEASE